MRLEFLGSFRNQLKTMRLEVLGVLVVSAIFSTSSFNFLVACRRSPGEQLMTQADGLMAVAADVNATTKHTSFQEVNGSRDQTLTAEIYYPQQLVRFAIFEGWIGHERLAWLALHIGLFLSIICSISYIAPALLDYVLFPKREKSDPTSKDSAQQGYRRDVIVKALTTKDNGYQRYDSTYNVIATPPKSKEEGAVPKADGEDASRQAGDVRGHQFLKTVPKQEIADDQKEEMKDTEKAEAAAENLKALKTGNAQEARQEAESNAQMKALMQAEETQRSAEWETAADLTAAQAAEEVATMNAYKRSKALQEVALAKHALTKNLADYSMVKKKALIPGGGTPEMEVAQKLAIWARGLGGIKAVCVEHYAEALELVPYTLAENAGMKSVEIVTKLRAAHVAGDKFAGINVKKCSISNMFDEKVVQPLLVSTNSIKMATETVRMILKIDDVVMTR